MTTVKTCGNCSYNTNGEWCEEAGTGIKEVIDSIKLPCAYDDYSGSEIVSVKSTWRPRLPCLIGKTIKTIDVDYVDNKITFVTSEGEKYVLYHDHSCCEEVEIESIVGDISDLLNTPILVSECSTSKVDENDEAYKSRDTDHNDCGTWSFYKFATIRGYVDIRWIGFSNGCYSEEVDFILKED